MAPYGSLTISAIIHIEQAKLPGESRKVRLARIERNTHISFQDAESRVSFLRSLNPGVELYAEFKPHPLYL